MFSFMAVSVGDMAPEFELVDTELKMRKLSDFKGKKVVLSFFVAASSPVCTNEMCTFLALNTSSLTLLPTTVIALRAAAGSLNPAEIVGTTMIATLCSTAVAVIADRLFRRRRER